MQDFRQKIGATCMCVILSELVEVVLRPQSQSSLLFSILDESLEGCERLRQTALGMNKDAITSQALLDPSDGPSDSLGQDVVNLHRGQGNTIARLRAPVTAHVVRLPVRIEYHRTAALVS